MAMPAIAGKLRNSGIGRCRLHDAEHIAFNQID
jgi:hypothetical protein